MPKILIKESEHKIEVPILLTALILKYGLGLNNNFGWFKIKK
ncbi:MAG: hypothetical protein ABIF17_00130 [Patescibacteria group bacterium]